jgi:hypothetical protein
MTANHRRDLLDMIDELKKQVRDLQGSRTLGVQPIYKKVLTASASSVRLPASGSIPQGFTNLRLVISAKSDGTGSSGYDPAYLRYNGITAANYNWNSIYATQGGAPASVSFATQTSMQCGEIWNAFWGSAGRGIIDLGIPDYSATDNLKPFTGLSTASDGGSVGIQQWYSGCLSAGHTEAISSLTVLMGTGSFVAGSTFTLYGS